MVDDGVLRALRASVEGDSGFVRELVEAYITDSATLVEAIEAAVAAGDADALVRPAHTLKSSSATLGAMTVSGTARTLELAGRSGSIEDPDTAAAAARMRSEWEAATVALRAWIDEAAPS